MPLGAPDEPVSRIERQVWHREGGMVFEARQGSPGSGEYHGYPLTPTQDVRGL